jgi:phosphopantothenoylcysteine decarboxylase / phosphopantothenate---cysteine ligase
MMCLIPSLSAPVNSTHTIAQPPNPTAGRRLLITAGPTQEPIDAVRFIGNRSSGRLGVALADKAAARGWRVTLLLGPTSLTPSDSRVEVVRFRTTTDLAGLLNVHFPQTDTLVMAAAVADYRPKPLPNRPDAAQGKLKRSEGGLTLELEPTPDLLAACSKLRQPGQTVIGFALEPRDRLMESARSKIARKGLDFIVANPLETMDAPTIEATLLGPAGIVDQTPGNMSKESFADWLLDRIPTHAAAAANNAPSAARGP